nr:MAG TPA: Protein of unknown function (DUF2634) [Caudoviricetes sp.]
MGLFPAYIEDEETTEELTEELETPREFGIDFSTGQLTGTIVEGVEAIKVWIYLALKIARYRYFICSWQYGNEIEDLYGQGYSTEHLESEISRMVEECLLENEYIDTVTVDDMVYIGGKIRAKVTVTTVYDEEVSETYETEAAA